MRETKLRRREPIEGGLISECLIACAGLTEGGRTLEVAILIVLGIGAFLILPGLLADEKTKLFRRVWSSERARGTPAVIDAQLAALNRLQTLYGIKNGDSPEMLRKSIANLMADAMTFDLKHPVNGGVEVTAVLVRHLRLRFPNLNDEE